MQQDASLQMEKYFILFYVTPPEVRTFSLSSEAHSEIKKGKICNNATPRS